MKNIMLTFEGGVNYEQIVYLSLYAILERFIIMLTFSKLLDFITKLSLDNVMLTFLLTNGFSRDINNQGMVKEILGYIVTSAGVIAILLGVAWICSRIGFLVSHGTDKHKL